MATKSKTWSFLAQLKPDLLSAGGVVRPLLVSSLFDPLTHSMIDPFFANPPPKTCCSI